MSRVSLSILLSFVLIGVAILAPILPRFVDDLIYPAHSDFSDLTITHWPAVAYLRDQVAATGQLPMWRTSILSGTPFAPDPLSGWFYPPHWIVLIPALPLALAFNLLMLFHLSLAAVTMYVMMRSWNAGRAAALASAIAYAAAPKIIAHMGVGHVTLVEAWAWLPFVIAALSKNKVVMAGAALALCLLADSRMAIYAAVLAVTYVIVRDARRDRSAWLRLSGRIIIVAIVALSISAVAWLPTLTLTGNTSRAALTPNDAGVLSLDPAYLLGVLIADRSGAAERTTYVGLVVLILAMGGATRIRKFSQGDWLIGVVIIGAIVALGVNTPLYNLLTLVPGSTLLRVPARAWFVVAFAVAALAGFGLQTLIDDAGRASRRSILIANAVSFFALLFGVIGGLSTGSISLMMMAIIVPLTCLLIVLRQRRKLSGARFVVLTIGLMAIDLLSFAWAVYRPISIEQAFADGQRPAQWLADQAAPFRTYSPSYSIPQHVAQQYHLQLADGINPLQLARYVAYMQSATGIGPWNYSVTLPPFQNIQSDEDIRKANANVIPDTRLLGALNVKYVVAAFPIDDPDLIERVRFGSTIIYENRRVRPRAFIVNRIDAAATPEVVAQRLATSSISDTAIVEGLPFPFELPVQAQAAQVVEWQADRIKVKATGPGWLVLSEVYMPDWSAQVDGEPTAIYPTDLALRGVFVNWGEHTIEFDYQPRRVYAGLLITVLSALACVIALMMKRMGHALHE
jgi:hypothetical protein